MTLGVYKNKAVLGLGTVAVAAALFVSFGSVAQAQVVYDIVLTDSANPAKSCQWNSQTGQYLFTVSPTESYTGKSKPYCSLNTYKLFANAKEPYLVTAIQNPDGTGHCAISSNPSKSPQPWFAYSVTDNN